MDWIALGLLPHVIDLMVEDWHLTLDVRRGRDHHLSRSLSRLAVSNSPSPEITCQRRLYENGSYSPIICHDANSEAPLKKQPLA